MKKHLFLLIILLTLLTFTVASADGFSTDPDAVEKAAKSVLMLEVMHDGNIIATGSGFVAFDNKTLVTNYHVIEGADMIFAQSDDGYEYIIMQVCIADEAKDLAILRFYSPTDLQPLPLHTAVDQKRIESVVAIGSPRGLKNTVSTGNISAVFEEDGTQWLQFTAPISNGSSGGALFNDEGEIIGVTSMTRKDSQNINFAVHAKEIQMLYEQWDGTVGPMDEHSSITTTPSPPTTKEATPSPAPKATKAALLSSFKIHSSTHNSITLEWSKIHSPNPLVFKVYYREKNIYHSTWISIKTTQNRITISTLAPGTAYEFKVIATDIDGATFESSVISFKTQSVTFVSPTPLIPTLSPELISALKYGASNSVIHAIKVKMQSYGYYTAGADLSLTYNAIMVERIKLFQKNNNLEVTGEIDNAFLLKLYSGTVIKANQFK